MERFQTTIRCRLTSSLILLFRDAPLPRAGTQPNPPTTHSMCDCNGSHHQIRIQQASKSWTILTRPHSGALCCPVNMFNTSTDWLRDEANFVDITTISHSPLHGNLFFLFRCFLSPFFMMKHLWSCLSGLSSQFSPDRRGYEWLICMWTGAFTSILIEAVVACLCVAWFPHMHWRVMKNWKRRQICYPYVALRGPLKQHPFMYNTETFKIIASFLSVLSLFLPLTHKHS